MLPHHVSAQPPPTVEVLQAEAALTEHYARLTRLAYLLLPAALPRHRRVRTAHALTQQALPWARVPDQTADPGGPAFQDTGSGGLPRDAAGGPGPRDAGEREARRDVDAGYGCVRVRVVRGALEVGAVRRRPRWAYRRSALPLLPLVWGLRLVPAPAGEAEFLLERRLAALDGPARGAVLLQVLEGLTADQTRRVLVAAGVTDPDGALATAARWWAPADRVPPGAGTVPAQRHRTDRPPVTGGSGGRGGAFEDAVRAEDVRDAGEAPAAKADGAGAAGGAVGAAGDGPATVEDTPTTPDDRPPAVRPAGSRDDVAALLASAPFDPCSLRAEPTDLLRRRQRVKTSLVLGCAVLICGPLLGVPGHHEHPDPAPTRTPYATDRPVPDPARLLRVGPGVWRTATRRDYSVWPVRGALTKDRALLRRALAAWVRPDKWVRVVTTPGTPKGAPPGRAQLLYAGALGRTRVVLLYDGLRLVRYTERSDDDRHGESPGRRPVLAVARADGADTAEAAAVVLKRAHGRVRYLSAPWVRRTAVVDLRKPEARPSTLPRSFDGVTAAAPAGPRSGACRSPFALQVRDGRTTRLLVDLGEPLPAHLTTGRPTAPGEATGRAARVDWSHVGCLLRAVRRHGVRTVNSWRYADERLPDGGGTAVWLCVRADTWRGGGSRVFVALKIPERSTGVVVASGHDSPLCGPRAPQVLAGVLWRSAADTWYLLAAGSANVAAISASGDVRGRVYGPILAVPAERGDRPRLTGRLADGTPVAPPH